MVSRRTTRTSFVAGAATAGALLLAVSVVAWAKESAPTQQPPASATAGPMAPQLSAFATARTPADRLPAAAEQTLANIAADAEALEASNRPGAPQVTQSRRLLAGVGPNDADFYAVPTNSGKVCFVITAGPSGCHSDFSRGPLAWGEYDADALGSGNPIAVYGLARDDVTSVHVVVNGRRERAQLTRNAFFYALADPTTHPTALIARLRSGAEEAITLAPPPRA